MLLGDRARRPRRACGRSRARSSTDVPFERSETRSPVAIPRRSASRRRQRDLARRAAGTGARGHARPAAPRRAAGSAAAGACPTKWSPSAAVRLRRRLGVVAGAGRDVRRRVRAAAPARRGPRGRGRRRSDRRAPRRRPPRAARASTSKRLGELREPGELVGHGRRHRAAEPLDAPLEVHRRPLALERRGRRAARGRPSRSASEWNIVIAITASALLGERADARVGGRLVAGDDEEPDRPRARPRPRRPPQAHASRDAARVRRRGEVERGAAGLRLEAERVRGLGEARAAAPARARPDQDRPLGLRAAACRARSARRRAPASASAAAARAAAGVSPRAPIVTISAPFRRACRSQRSTTGARSTTCVVADDDHELGVADRRRAARGTRRAPRTSTRGGRPSARRARGA